MRKNVTEVSVLPPVRERFCHATPALLDVKSNSAHFTGKNDGADRPDWRRSRFKVRSHRMSHRNANQRTAFSVNTLTLLNCCVLDPQPHSGCG